MNISVIHPSRGRAQQAFETAKKWLSNSDNEYEYILSLDDTDFTKSEYWSLFGNFNEPNKIRAIGCTNDNKSAISAINSAAAIATGDIFVVISDDFDCPEHWNTLLIEEVDGLKDFVLKTRDGIQKLLVTLPIMDRTYYERFGYVYHPDYIHMGCDVELTAVAVMTGKLLCSDLTFPHLHYSTGKTPKDAINDKNDSTYKHGDEVLARHKANNFGIENPIISFEQIVWH